MNAVIIAAGSGKRISDAVKNTPKSLIKINGKPIIDYQITALRKAGIEDITVITGPHSEKFNVKGVNYVKDQYYSNHDILGSLMEAKEYFKKNTLVLYSDIIFENEIINQILKSKKNISIAVDMNWEKMYENRTEHPKSEAENILLNHKGEIIQIKKNIQNEKRFIGEFLGIIKFSLKGSQLFIEKYNELINTNSSENFHEAPSIKKAYLTDMIQELIDSKINVEPILISNKWCEIDTMQDLKKAEKIFSD
jgi:L-glutamine-phosphate cytidylyltransferase